MCSRCYHIVRKAEIEKAGTSQIDAAMQTVAPETASAPTVVVTIDVSDLSRQCQAIIAEAQERLGAAIRAAISEKLGELSLLAG
jgi:ribosome-binding protein aMBF1 (putative translation factor)